MPIRADGLNLEGFLPEPNINPNVQQRGVPTLAESLMMAAQPVTGRVEHFLNDPVQQANQSLLMGGPMAAVSGPMRLGGLLKKPRFKNPLPGPIAKGQTLKVSGLNADNAKTLFDRIKMGHRIELLNGMDITEDVIRMNTSQLPELLGPNASQGLPDLLGPGAR